MSVLKVSYPTLHVTDTIHYRDLVKLYNVKILHRDYCPAGASFVVVILNGHFLNTEQ